MLIWCIWSFEAAFMYGKTVHNDTPSKLFSMPWSLKAAEWLRCLNSSLMKQ
jgi:hypothetical protein